MMSSVDLESSVSEVEESKKEFPWYILNPSGKFTFVWNTTINLVNWSVAILLPIHLVIRNGDFSTDKGALQFLIYADYIWWVTDILWLVEIVLKFLKADDLNKDLKSIAFAYLKSGNFPIDLIATLPTIVTFQDNDYCLWTKFLRMRYFGRLFQSINIFLQKMMPGQSAHIIQQIVSYIIINASMLLLAHFSACVWMYLGYEDQFKPFEQRKSWYYNPDNGFAGYKAWQLYVFSYYWVFQVFATVGYGDVTGKTKNEYMFSVVLEFLGMSFFSLLMGTTVSFVKSVNTGFGAFYDSKINFLDQWVMRVDRSCQVKHLDSKLYMTILRQCEEAFQFDFNMIIEEYEFYQKLTPRMQTELISYLFKDFRNNFKHLFDWCEEGFVNSLIINCYVRLYHNMSQLVQPEGKTFSEFMMITNGSIGIHIKQSRALYQLPQFSFLGDWQLLCNLKSIYNYKTYFEPGQDYEPTRVMCIKKSRFNELCSLYPKTAANFKIRALERRKRISKEVDLQFLKELEKKTEYLEMLRKQRVRASCLDLLTNKTLKVFIKLNDSIEEDGDNFKDSEIIDLYPRLSIDEIGYQLCTIEEAHKKLIQIEQGHKSLNINLEPPSQIHEQETDSEPELRLISRQERKLEQFIRSINK